MSQDNHKNQPVKVNEINELQDGLSAVSQTVEKTQELDLTPIANGLLAENSEFNRYLKFTAGTELGDKLLQLKEDLLSKCTADFLHESAKADNLKPNEQLAVYLSDFYHKLYDLIIEAAENEQINIDAETVFKILEEESRRSFVEACNINKIDFYDFYDHRKVVPEDFKIKGRRFISVASMDLKELGAIANNITEKESNDALLQLELEISRVITDHDGLRESLQRGESAADEYITKIFEKVDRKLLIDQNSSYSKLREQIGKAFILSHSIRFIKSSFEETMNSMIPESNRTLNALRENAKVDLQQVLDLLFNKTVENGEYDINLSSKDVAIRLFKQADQEILHMIEVKYEAYGRYRKRMASEEEMRAEAIRYVTEELIPKFKKNHQQSTDEERVSGHPSATNLKAVKEEDYDVVPAEQKKPLLGDLDNPNIDDDDDFDQMFDQLTSGQAISTSENSNSEQGDRDSLEIPRAPEFTDKKTETVQDFDEEEDRPTGVFNYHPDEEPIKSSRRPDGIPSRQTPLPEDNSGKFDTGLLGGRDLPNNTDSSSQSVTDIESEGSDDKQNSTFSNIELSDAVNEGEEETTQLHSIGAEELKRIEQEAEESESERTADEETNKIEEIEEIEEVEPIHSSGIEELNPTFPRVRSNSDHPSAVVVQTRHGYIAGDQHEQSEVKTQNMFAVKIGDQNLPSQETEQTSNSTESIS
ncbi:hypothetical protein GF376_04535, partial [Candidatus Peregrinibacteria bacterium]|nr:hypothetical protein [Candidatus Peregrinibacteria bacterium]